MLLKSGLFKTNLHQKVMVYVPHQDTKKYILTHLCQIFSF